MVCALSGSAHVLPRTASRRGSAASLSLSCSGRLCGRGVKRQQTGCAEPAVWHKFYAERNRKWTRSDAFDIIISSAIPYVDAVVTESHLAEGLRKTKRLDDFIEHLTIYTLRDFRHSPPRAAVLDAMR
jgi:hypothetical protein